MTFGSMREEITVPILTATMTPFTEGALGLFFQPLAGPAGVLLPGTQGRARQGAVISIALGPWLDTLPALEP